MKFPAILIPLVVLATAVFANAPAQASQDRILTLGGAIAGGEIGLTRADFQEFPQHQIVTTTSVTDGPQTFEGYGVLERLRRDHPHLAHVPLVFLSALSMTEAVIRGKRAGADDYLTPTGRPILWRCCCPCRCAARPDPRCSDGARGCVLRYRALTQDAAWAACQSKGYVKCCICLSPKPSPPRLWDA